MKCKESNLKGKESNPKHAEEKKNPEEIPKYDKTLTTIMNNP